MLRRARQKGNWPPDRPLRMAAVVEGRHRVPALAGREMEVAIRLIPRSDSETLRGTERRTLDSRHVPIAVERLSRHVKPA